MKTTFIQIFARVAIATAFLSAVADRLGYWGEPGQQNVTWGNWDNFVAYANTLNFFVPDYIGSFLAIAATFLEALLGILLLVGYKTRLSALLSGILLTLFAVSMTLSLGIKSTFDYSVWIGAASCFLLASIGVYPYSVDNYFFKKPK